MSMDRWMDKEVVINIHNGIFSSDQSLSHARFFVNPWTAACQDSLSITNSWSAPKPMSIMSVIPSNHLILCHPLLLLPSLFPSIRVFSNVSVLCIRWPKYWSFSFNISPSNERPGLTSFRMEYYSTIKRNTFESVLMRWMNLEPITQSEESPERERQILYINTHIWNLYNTPTYRAAKETET